MNLEPTRKQHFLLLEMTGFLCVHVVAPLNTGLIVVVDLGGRGSVGDGFT